MNKSKISVGIVTFNPEIRLLVKNIKSIIKQVDVIYIFDNGSKNIDEIEKTLNRLNKIRLLKEDKNHGIAYALNKLCEKAIDDGYDYIITLDQDSISPDNLVYELVDNVEDDIAVIAPNIIYKNNEKYCDFNTRGLVEVDWLITSASLTNLGVWKKINGFDEKLFIDGVDKDFCLRAKKNGYKVIKDYNVHLIHELGNLKCKKLLGRVIYVTNHSAKRKYYMVRNSIYLDKKLGLDESKKTILKNIFKIIIYEEHKIKKIFFIFKGIIDGTSMIKKLKLER